MSTQNLKMIQKKAMMQNPLNHRSLLKPRGYLEQVFDWYGFLEVLVDFVSKVSRMKDSGAINQVSLFLFLRLVLEKLCNSFGLS